MNEENICSIYEKYSFLCTSQKLPQNQDILLHELGCLSKNFEDFVHNGSVDTCTSSEVVVKLAEMIVSFGSVKAFNESEDRDFDSSDFPYEAANAEECFEYLNYLLGQYGNVDTASKRKFLVQVLLLCATHNSKYCWSSEGSVSSSKDFLQSLLKVSKHEKLNHLLLDDTFYPTIFKGILKLMRPYLMKDTWMKNPSYCHIFYWLLSHIKHPHLIDYLNDVLPPPFMFTNYYAVPQQVLGIQCFDHILDNVPPSLLASDGTEDAIFDSLKKYIYSKDVQIIQVLYPCLLKLPMMNLRKVNNLQWLQFDDVLQQLLRNADLECDPKLRHLFLSQIYLFIQHTPCFKHLKKSLCVLLQNLTANSIAEEKCRVISLKIIKELVRSCWPRMEHHCYNITLAILKAVYDIENPSYTPDNALSREVLLLCEECLKLLKQACPKTVMNLVNEYIDEDDSLPGVSVLRSLS